jgi:hypothetical protein
MSNCGKAENESQDSDQLRPSLYTANNPSLARFRTSLAIDYECGQI